MSPVQKSSPNVVWKMRAEFFWAYDQNRSKALISVMPSDSSPRIFRMIAEFNVLFACVDEN